MAKIEMDISEYDIMRENKILLEKSLEKERALQEEITKLQEEKIKVLEDAKMKVVKITKTEHKEHVYRTNNEYEAYRKLANFLGLHPRDHMAYIQNNLYYEELKDAFFVKTIDITYPVEEVTIHGLDEIKSELRGDIKKEIDQDIKQKLKEAEDILSQQNTLIKDNQKLTSENTDLYQYNKKLLKEVDELKVELDKQKEVLTEKLTESITKEINNKLADQLADSQLINKKLDKIKNILADGYGLFNKSDLLDQIINLTK